MIIILSERLLLGVGEQKTKHKP